MQIENLLTRRSRLDRRFKLTRSLGQWFNRYTQASAMYGLIVGVVIGLYLSDTPKNPSQALSEPLKTVVEAKEVKIEPPCDSDPLTYIRCRGQQLGYDDYTISKFIRIAKAESETSTKYSKTVIPYNGVSGLGLDPYAKNPNSTAKGIFQFIDGTWRGYCLKMGDVYDYKANTNCFYKVLEVDGYPKGLNHWNASKHKWGK